ncbi:FG-GAP-like repeat-containing protein [Nonomuraea typhae]|uniref:FG-GAP-like repeat-containing protein n=1 Tax=Nonomuraea typhae TaxID=2603600 RepID=UPI0012F7B90D|nr:FG-GAP-like repeat-containing protein [Nonomuraea typhae]
MPRIPGLLVFALLVGGCAAPQPGEQPSPARAVPIKGAKLQDDVNGDGFSDLVFQIADSGLPRMAIVYGSRDGLTPAENTVIPAKRFTPWIIDAGIQADLDGDGYGDIVAFGGHPGGDERGLPRVYWGDRAGIGPEDTAVPIVPPTFAQSSVYRAVTGDFDGDGAADVAMATPEGTVTAPEGTVATPEGTVTAPEGTVTAPEGTVTASEGTVAAPEGTSGDTSSKPALELLYGPFDRNAKPARRAKMPSPTGGEFWRMAVDRTGSWPTGLLVFEADDGEQTSGWLLSGRLGGPAAQGRKLNPGMAAAFGDFDGDGTRDVAVGDDGSRNDEPGFESEPPGVDDTLTVYYGNGREKRFTGAKGRAVATDLDGDGHDDLLVGAAPGGSSSETAKGGVRVYRGAQDGLPAGEILAGALGEPLAAGDYNGDGHGEVVLSHGEGGKHTISVTDGERILTTFTTDQL